MKKSIYSAVIPAALCALAFWLAPVHARAVDVVWDGDPSNPHLTTIGASRALVPLGAGYENAVSGNTVTVRATGQVLTPFRVYGGRTTGNGPVSGNTVVIEFLDAPQGQVRGGDSNGTGIVSGNRVVFRDGKVNEIIGGSGESAASGNVVEVFGGTVSIGVSGGSSNGTATGNRVVLHDGQVGSITGGLGGDAPASATNNVVEIRGGTVTGDVTGGWSFGSSGTTTNNAVLISGGKISGNVYGGYNDSNTSAAHANNSITISGSPDLENATLLGSSSILDRGIGNTLNIHRFTGKVKGVANFQAMNFFLPATLANNAVVLEVSSESNLGTNLAVGVGFAGGGVLPGAGDTYTLLKKSVGNVAAESKQGQARKGVSVLYDYDIDDSGTVVTLRLRGNGRVDPDAQSIAMGRAGALAALTNAADTLLSSGLPAAEEAVADQPFRPAVFAALSGGSYRHTTGSHIDVDSFSGLLGLAWRPGGAGGSLLLGAFAEFGYADYDSTTRGITGSGTGSSAGGGVLARYGHDTGFFADASLRLGSSRLEFDPGLYDFIGDSAKYKSTAVYWGGHIRTGHVWDFSRGTLDVSAAWLWSRLGSDSFRAANDPVRFKHADSHRFRLGGRYAWRTSDKRFSPYAGAYYEYEAKGKSRGSAYGFAYSVPSLKGSTGIAEAGLSMRSHSFPALTAQIGVEASVGRRRGFGGAVRMGWAF